VYEAASTVGNGRVSVTAHASSVHPLPGCDRTEWRVLRFGEATRQSVALVDVRAQQGGSGASTAAGRPGALAFEYVKSVVACAAAVLGSLPASVLDAAASPAAALGPAAGDRGPSQSPPPPPTPPGPISILCIGVGGGSIPVALASAFPGAAVTGVELCGAVLGAAPAMGAPAPGALPNLATVRGDGVAARAAAPAGSVHLLVVDAYDGDDAVPAPLCTPGGAGLVAAASALHPSHGALVINLHAGPKPGPWDLLQRRASSWLGRSAAAAAGAGGPHPTTFTVRPDGAGPGAAAVAAAQAWTDAVLTGSRSGSDDGCAYMVGVRRQANAVGVVARSAGGAGAGAGTGEGRLDSAPGAAAAALRAASRSALVLPFDVGDRASYGWWCVPRG
jgi:hypothetical protein